MGRRSDKHNSGLRGMRSNDAGEQQENTQQKGNTQESSKDAYHDSLPDHSSLHLVFLLLLLTFHVIDHNVGRLRARGRVSRSVTDSARLSSVSV